MSRRALILAELKKAAEAVHGRRYFVKRGPINWVSFPFADHPFAIAIGVESENLGFLNPDDGMSSMNLVLEIYTKLEQNPEEPGFDDGLLDEIHADAEALVVGVQAYNDGRGNCLSAGVYGVRAMEIADATMNVQGVVLSFGVDYE